MIQEKLQKARLELQNKSLKKSGKNKFSGFTYFELADFLPSVNQIFFDLKMFSNFSLNESQATLTITDWEDNTKEIFTSPIEELELKGCTKIQALGGVHTYMKRYLYLNALEIIESDMLDVQAGNIEEKPKKPQAKITKDDLVIYTTLYKIDDVEAVKSYYELNKENVIDREKFHKECENQIKGIKRIKATIPEGKLV